MERWIKGKFVGIFLIFNRVWLTCWREKLLKRTWCFRLLLSDSFSFSLKSIKLFARGHVLRPIKENIIYVLSCGFSMVQPRMLFSIWSTHDAVKNGPIKSNFHQNHPPSLYAYHWDKRNKYILCFSGNFHK